MSDTSIKKTIIINPNLLIGAGNKTKKNIKRDKPKSVISPNILRNKFLKRIKEQKIMEEKEKKKEKENSHSVSNNFDFDTDKNETIDEFKESLHFIKHFSTENKSKYKTLKNDFSSNTNIPDVYLDLPKDLEELHMPLTNQPIEKSSIQVNYKVDNVVPHGCLKNGMKPTFRNWNKTQKQSLIEDPIAVSVERLPNVLKEPGVKEPGVKEQGVKEQSVKEQSVKEQNVPKDERLLKKEVSKEERLKMLKHKILNLQKEKQLEGATSTNKDKKDKKKTKRTTTRRFTLGKSPIHRRVGILIKDKKTRKKILEARKEMKKKDIFEIKKYLHARGLLAIGSNPPIDVLRQMYENSMLSGEIKNTDSDVILHNLLNSPE